MGGRRLSSSTDSVHRQPFRLGSLRTHGRRSATNLSAFETCNTTPATLHTDVGFVHSPRLVCRLEMLSQSLLQLRAVILHPAPDRGVIDIETTLLQPLLNIP